MCIRDRVKRSFSTHPFPASVILYKDGVTHHDVAERSDGNWNQSVPGGEKVKEKGVEEARYGRAENAPRRLEKGCVEARENVDDAVADDQTVDSSSLLPQDADPGQEVDYKGDQGDGNVCKKVRPCLCNVHLD